MSAASRPLRPTACPSCRAVLELADRNLLRCRREGLEYPCDGGIWRLLDPSLRAATEGFLARYRVVRRSEGWGSDDAGYYRELPFADRTGRHEEIWRLRAVTYRSFERHVLARSAGGLTTLDLGAGNGWLAHRLARRQHRVAAVDLNDDTRDGLGAHIHYGAPPPFVAVQASYDRLPWPDDFADLIVFNGSLHYSVDYVATLREARRVLRPDGRLVVLDSPFYRRAESGAAMVRERDEALRAAHGDDLPTSDGEGYLTLERLRRLGKQLGIAWQVVTPFYGVRWALRPLLNGLRGLRAPMRLHLVIGRLSAPRD